MCDFFRPHTSLSGKQMDKLLFTFERQCDENMNTYIKTISEGMQLGKHVPLVPVFTTEAVPQHRAKK